MAGQRRALIVATETYEHQTLRGLRAPSADAQALARVLGDPAIGAFDVDVVENESAHAVEVRLEDLFADARPDDLLLVHFSCHGLKSDAGELFFAATDTRPDRLGSTAVSAAFIQRCLTASRSRSIVLLLDCCYGGAFSKGVSVRGSGSAHPLDSFPAVTGGGRSRAVITASSAMEYAFEGTALAAASQGQPSLFTSAVVRGLETGEADRDADGWVSLDELYDYVYDAVRAENPHQTPSRDVEMHGDVYLARSGRRPVEAAPVPAHAGGGDPTPAGPQDVEPGPAAATSPRRSPAGAVISVQLERRSLAEAASVLVAGAAIIAGIGLPFQWGGPLTDRVSYAAWYLLAVGSLAVVGAALSVGGRTAGVGRGLLLSATAGTTWGLVFVLAYLGELGVEGLGSGFALEVLALLVLLGTGISAGRRVVRESPRASAAGRLPTGWTAWSIVGAGAVGAVLLTATALTLSDSAVGQGMTAVWAALLAVVVPTGALSLRPAGLAGAALIGWAVLGLGLFAAHHVMLDDVGHYLVIDLFAGSVLAIAALTPFWVNRVRSAERSGR